MSAQNDGGPAFPGAWFDHLEGIGEVRREQYHGMTLRDWFAGQALAGMLANPALVRWADDYKTVECGKVTLDWDLQRSAISFKAGQIADAMLAAREAKQ